MLNNYEHFYSKALHPELFFFCFRWSSNRKLVSHRSNRQHTAHLFTWREIYKSLSSLKVLGRGIKNNDTCEDLWRCRFKISQPWVLRQNDYFLYRFYFKTCPWAAIESGRRVIRVYKFVNFAHLLVCGNALTDRKMTDCQGQVNPSIQQFEESSKAPRRCDVQQNSEARCWIWIAFLRSIPTASVTCKHQAVVVIHSQHDVSLTQRCIYNTVRFLCLALLPRGVSDQRWMSSVRLVPCPLPLITALNVKRDPIGNHRGTEPLFRACAWRRGTAKNN